ncbi:hypothetical protein I8752_28745 [Nostocaceae cyanobacterium CENA369]|uniref:Uncharacterized protein n=1 Tax=Dendronalium phyllosphericum CENA369 TaxID=1725256 RepID=A0A8J7LIP1_9NOST|nr:hypothetical protein [Dendronalium phyllosphericum]MBH8576904.1 hypothetical protein [Dendronalium phyllosphericum CENA369]
MKLSKGIQTFWAAVASYILLGLTLFSYLLASNGWKLTNLLSLPDIISFIIVIALVVFPLLWFLSNLKLHLLQATPNEWQFKVAILAEYPQLDLSWLQQQTTTLESLGFVHLMDYKVDLNTGFTRCFAHPQEYCFAEINQIFQKTGEAIAINCCVFSLLQQDWVVAVMNREVERHDGIPYMWRNSKHVRTYEPNLNLNELLQNHLGFRQQIVTNLGITVSTDVSWFAYRNLEQQAIIYRKQNLRRKNLFLAMLEATLFEINPKSKWLGDYPKEVAKRRLNNR